MHADQLSSTFAALSDPTRRAILARLASGEATVTELAAPFKISGPAITKHLKVLERAGLIVVAARRSGVLGGSRRRRSRASTTGSNRYRRFWEQRSTAWTTTCRNFNARRNAMAAESSIDARRPRTGCCRCTRVFDAPRCARLRGLDPPAHIQVLVGAARVHDALLLRSTCDPVALARCCPATAAVAETAEHGVFREIVEPATPGLYPCLGGPEGTPGLETLVTVTFVEHDGKTS